MIRSANEFECGVIPIVIGANGDPLDYSIIKIDHTEETRKLEETCCHSNS